MFMQWWDWGIVFGLAAALITALVFCNRYVRNAADFLSANRCAGRYVLCISNGIAAIGAVSIVAVFELYYQAGFVPTWWEMMRYPVTIILTMTAWVSYRRRETRALTLAQLLEMRYGRNFRVFTGILAWLSGLLNYGIFPAVSVSVFIHFAGLPQHYQVGGVTVSTYATLLIICIGMGVVFAIAGGQVAIMVTDFLQGMFCNITFLVILLFVFLTVKWDWIIEAMQTTAKPGASLIHPFHSGKIKDFGFWYYAIAMVGALYNAGSWQGNSGYAAAARTPHESRMSGLLGFWRGQAQTLCIFMLPLVAFAVMNHPHYADLARQANTALGQIADENTRKQMTAVVALRQIIPTGLAGMFIAMIFATMLSTDDTYMHSWGTIFIQDVILPFRKKAFTPRQHIWLLRFSIIFVGLFAFLFSLLFRQTEYILLYFAITGAIFTGGAGIVIIGGLYWKRGTTQAAWAAMITGSTLAVSGIILQQYKTFGFTLPDWMFRDDGKLRLNGQQILFCAYVTSTLVYAVVSLLTCREKYNLDKLLHRGKYDTHGEHATQKTHIFDWRRFGVTPEFTRGDKILYWLVQAWMFGWTAFFFGVTIWHFFIRETTEKWWTGFWYVKVGIAFGLGLVTTVWFAIGGVLDVVRLFRDLRDKPHDAADDGRVIHGHSAGDEAIEAVDEKPSDA